MPICNTPSTSQVQSECSRYRDSPTCGSKDGLLGKDSRTGSALKGCRVGEERPVRTFTNTLRFQERTVYVGQQQTFQPGRKWKGREVRKERIGASPVSCCCVGVSETGLFRKRKVIST